MIETIRRCDFCRVQIPRFNGTDLEIKEWGADGSQKVYDLCDTCWEPIADTIVKQRDLKLNTAGGY